jgi:hypothetical protein
MCVLFPLRLLRPMTEIEINWIPAVTRIRWSTMKRENKVAACLAADRKYKSHQKSIATGTKPGASLKQYNKAMRLLAGLPPNRQHASKEEMDKNSRAMSRSVAVGVFLYAHIRGCRSATWTEELAELSRSTTMHLRYIVRLPLLRNKRSAAVSARVRRRRRSISCPSRRWYVIRCASSSSITPAHHVRGVKFGTVTRIREDFARIAEYKKTDVRCVLCHFVFTATRTKYRTLQDLTGDRRELADYKLSVGCQRPCHVDGTLPYAAHVDT